MIKAIVVDDECAALEITERLLHEVSDIDAICFQSARKAKEYLTYNSVHLAILDIEMPEISGFELANFILFESDINKNCSIVFATGYNEYAVEAFEICALDYLVKPISLNRLAKTIGRLPLNKEITSSTIRLTARCFDDFRLFIGENEVKFRTKKAQELIAFLIYKQGKCSTRSEIIDNLWPDFDGDKAVINFNTTLSYAKKALLLHGIMLPVFYERGLYRIDLNEIDCDYISFLQCNINEKHLDDDNIEYYEKLLVLYTGDLFASNDYAWAEKQRIYLKDKYLHLLLLLARYYENTGKDTTKLIELMKAGFSVAPLDREITYIFIAALLQEGNYSLAVSYYRTHRRAMQEMLHREPDELLKKLMGFVT